MEQIISLIKTLAYTIPLDVFAFMEEIIAPIPSPLVMTTAGTLAHTQNHSLCERDSRFTPDPLKIRILSGISRACPSLFTTFRAG